ncbi:cobyric acid synthase, partial [bacterium]|nr:cobyric acid synthase [bacterium]
MNEGRLAKCVAVLGTGSDVGKSVAVAALCRLLSDAGLRVAPFKAQNMSNNSWVTYDGGEMGRAQVVQAQAARVEPHVDMNPVLLKPNTDLGAQVVLHGRVLGDREASDYWKDTEALAGEAAASLRRLRERFDVIVIEGAGSCAELNLRDRDFVNFRTAHAADAAVILIGDIDRGGVFAQIIGTLAILPEGDRARVKAFLVNRFRGDARLFDDGLQILEKRTGLPSLGLIPMYRDIDIDAEDALPLDAVLDPPEGPRSGRVNVAVLCL